MLTDAEKDAIRDHYRALTLKLSGFRPRSAQRKMLAEVAQAFARCLERDGEDNPQREGESIAVIEGPTGVGKSLAYLLAGGVMARSRNKKLVISSATVALQEQLVNRDLPFVVENSGLPLTFALAKGRSRYLCPYRLYQLTSDATQGELLAPDPSALWERKPQQEELDALRELADAFHQRKWNGDRDQWPQTMDDGLWSRVTNDRHGCLKVACPNRAECPFYLARETLETVDVVVTNHDLMLADIGMGGGVILPAPEISFYCIDEAHHLAKKAVNQFAAEHSLAQALAWLAKVEGAASGIGTLSGKGELASRAIEAAAAASESLSEWLWLLEGEKALARSSDSLEPTWLIEDGVLPEHLQSAAANMAMASRMVFKHLSQLAEALAEARKDKSGETAAFDQAASNIGILEARAEQMMALWDLFEKIPGADDAPIAKWVVRKSEGKGDYLFCASPVSAAANLAATLWRRAAGALLTSATLRSLGAFDLLLEQTGLKALPKVSCMALDSPFDFGAQGELYLPPLLASPKDPDAHTREIADWLPRLIDSSQAVGSLVLFSSRKQMQEVAALLPADLRAHLSIQGEIPKSLLIAGHHQRLQQGKASVIFGLDSFSEGLDLPGDSCVHVIIAKLPFAMPDDPIGRTLSRWIEKRGGNPFTELTVPEASIKLVQAVGRLIRSEQDYGRVTILDNRLTRQSYGKKMLASLPPFKRI
jgi:ATP-dependent DNA helicase DinG